jgi:hypothetical protein
MSPVSRGFHHLQRAQDGQASRVPRVKTERFGATGAR